MEQETKVVKRRNPLKAKQEEEQKKQERKNMYKFTYI